MNTHKPTLILMEFDRYLVDFVDQESLSGGYASESQFSNGACSTLDLSDYVLCLPRESRMKAVGEARRKVVRKGARVPFTDLSETFVPETEPPEVVVAEEEEEAVFVAEDEAASPPYRFQHIVDMFVDIYLPSMKRPRNE
ncbi:uncharacterized protein LOC131010790 [Salvia miltiorrhiza]|uniref:uncharacterized protein LOC131010790 n=1 Tax=Salvia miltiorrhiza TaxID=226208 RepID=UPI0025AD500D|nr:uncharacterized protein LOC131010790 [Salvia miltiorrhiza]